MRHRAIGVLVAVRDRVADRDRIVVEIPGEAMHAATCREHHRWARPVEREPAEGCGWIRLAQAIVRDGIERRMRVEDGIVTRVAANDFPAVLEDFELHLTARIVR